MGDGAAALLGAGDPRGLRGINCVTAPLAGAGRGGNLTEVAQLLRHETEVTAAIYAKVDLAALRMAARPWPRWG